MSSPSDPSNPPADATVDGPDATPQAADGQGSVPAMDLRPALHRLRVERRILSDERGAFRRFCDHLLEYDGGAPAGAIRAAYRETVMAVPHYRTEYGDTLFESVAAELGATLAHELEVRGRVDDATVTALRRAGERSLEARDELVDRIDAERHAIADAAEQLESIRTELLALDVLEAPAGDGPTRLTLASLRERCDAIARDRREELAAGTDDCDDVAPPILEEDGGLETEGSEEDRFPPGHLQHLCYRELETDWPVLAAVEALRDAIERRRQAVLEARARDEVSAAER